MTILEANSTGTVRIGEQVYTLLRPSYVYNHTEAQKIVNGRPNWVHIHISNQLNCERVENYGG